MRLTPFFILAIALSTGFGSEFEFKDDEDALVETQYGKIQGTTTLATNGKIIYSFKSIPFAKPPVRFEAPVALDAEDGWGDEIRDGTKNPPSCAQLITNLSPVSEDCLYLNVYTPVKPGTVDVAIPVMVFIYGGAFLFGDSVIYGPNRLLASDEEVVIVVIHYRLGAIGFLSTGDEVVPGNNGLKDQREALRWVQYNIAAFNGDRNRVTIFGESAGSNSVLSQLLSPSTQGLFHQVIAQSGTPLSVWSMDPKPVESATRFAESVGCNEWDTTAEMVACLRQLPWQTLANASLVNLVTGIGQLEMDFGALALVVEPDLPGAFMIEEPLDILKQGNFPHIPVLLGSNQHEASFVLGALWSFNYDPSGVLDDPNYVRFELVPKLLNAVRLGDEALGAPISQSIAEYFYPPEARRDNFTEITDALVNMLTVLFFKAPILRTADYLSQHSDQIYLYNFEREGFNSIWKLVFDLLAPVFGFTAPPVKHGVTHADDLIYFWTLPFLLSGDDRQFSNMVCKIWTDFAATSNPTPPGTSWPTWTNYKTGVPHYYKLDLQPELLLDYTKNWRQGYQSGY